MNCGTLNLILDENRFIKSYVTSINFEMKALKKSQQKQLFILKYDLMFCDP